MSNKERKRLHYDPPLRPTGTPKEVIIKEIYTYLGYQTPEVREELKIIETPEKKADREFFEKVYAFADNAHGTSGTPNRASGDETITHPLMTAYYLITRLGITDLDLVIPLVLHDVVEDTEIKLEDIQELTQNERIKLRVDGLTKIKSSRKLPSKEIADLMTQDRLIEELTEDYMTIVLKLHDVLHNMQTGPKAKNAHLALELYEPIARSLGLIGYAQEIGNHALEVLHPQRYEELKAIQSLLVIDNLRLTREIRSIQNNINALLDISGMSPLINSSSLPGIYEIYKLTPPNEKPKNEVLFPKIEIVMESQAELLAIYQLLDAFYGSIQQENNYNPILELGKNNPLIKIIPVRIGNTTYNITCIISSIHMKISPIDLLHLTPDPKDPYYKIATERLADISQLSVEAAKEKKTIGYMTTQVSEQMSRGAIIYTDKDRNEHRVAVGSTLRDAAFAIGKNLGLSATRVTVIRNNTKQVMPLTDSVSPGDQLTFDTTGRKPTPIELIDQVTTRKALRDIAASINEQNETMKERLRNESLKRGMRILTWLYELKRGKRLDIYPRFGFEANSQLKETYPEVYDLLFQLGQVCIPALKSKDIQNWMVLGDTSDLVTHVQLLVDELIDFRETRPSIRIDLKDQVNVIGKIGSLASELELNIASIRGGHDINELILLPLSSDPAYLEIIILDNDPKIITKFVQKLNSLLPDAKIQHLSGHANFINNSSD